MTRSKPPLPMRPDGIMGRPFAWIMTRMNARTYTEILKYIAPKSGASVLEIGYGTGEFLARVGQSMQTGLLAGLDPAPLMQSVAIEKLQQSCDHLELDVRKGDDHKMDWPPATFDYVIAIHSFQFWKAPQETLRAIYKQMKPAGTLCFALRQHGKNPPKWLPNPISRSADETKLLMKYLEDCGFIDIQMHASPHVVIICAMRYGDV